MAEITDDRQIDERIAWAVLDMETTGLSATSDVPLELGIKLIDLSGYVIAEKAMLISENTSRYNEGYRRGKADPFVNAMHNESGLWEDLSDADEVYSLKETDWLMTQWLRDCGAPMGLGMMGNSIGSLDRPFTLNYFPHLDEFLGYRNIDMSTLKELVKKLNPELYKQIEHIVSNKESATHRVMGDIDACILEYRTYGIEFLLVGDEVDF